MHSLDDQPDWISFDAWQGSDNEHPPGSGQSAFRAVFKTARVGFEDARLEWPNFLVRFGCGRIPIGGVRTPGVLPTRKRDHFLLPEYGELRADGTGSRTYTPVARVDPTYEGWLDETPPCFFVELIVDVDADSPSEKIVEGRRSIASMLTHIDLRFGERVLGALIAEEPGERFEDWHFNRQLGGRLLGWEPQLEAVPLPEAELRSWAEQSIGKMNERPVEERRRIGLASVWYQAALSATDPTTEFLDLWFSIEILAMPGTTNVAPLRRRLETLTGYPEGFWKEPIGRLFGQRSDVVHGNNAKVTTRDVTLARLLARLLLADELDVVLEPHQRALFEFLDEDDQSERPTEPTDSR